MSETIGQIQKPATRLDQLRAAGDATCMCPICKKLLTSPGPCIDGYCKGRATHGAYWSERITLAAIEERKP